MILNNSNDYYTTDQGIPLGDRVLVWNSAQLEDSFVLKRYNKYDPVTKEHIAGNMPWKSAVRVTEPVELDPGQVDPVPVTPDNSFYGEVWVKAYATSGDTTIADDALMSYKIREANGDFKK